MPARGNSVLRVILSYFRAIWEGHGHRTSPILLRFSLKSCFRVLTGKWMLKSSSSFFLWEISRRQISSDLGGPPLRRIEWVLVISILILPSQFLDNSCNRHKELSFFVLFINIILENDEFEWPTAKRLKGIIMSLKIVANLLQIRSRLLSPLLSRLRTCHLPWTQLV